MVEKKSTFEFVNDFSKLTSEQKSILRNAHGWNLPVGDGPVDELVVRRVNELTDASLRSLEKKEKKFRAILHNGSLIGFIEYGRFNWKSPTIFFIWSKGGVGLTEFKRQFHSNPVLYFLNDFVRNGAKSFRFTFPLYKGNRFISALKKKGWITEDKKVSNKVGITKKCREAVNFKEKSLIKVVKRRSKKSFFKKPSRRI